MEITTSLYTILILLIVFSVGIDTAGYIGSKWKLNNVCSETLQYMKAENGFDSGTATVFRALATSQGLDASRITVSGTPKTVQRGDTITIYASMPYTLRALRPLGKELNVTIRTEMSGLAQEFIR